jgi:transcriptional regulator with XRE-family HTH domain
MDIKTEIGRRLRAIRIQKGLSQEALSRKSGIDRSFISDVENGKRNITVDTLAQFLKELKISFRVFFDGIK